MQKSDHPCKGSPIFMPDRIGIPTDPFKIQKKKSGSLRSSFLPYYNLILPNYNLILPIHYTLTLLISSVPAIISSKISSLNRSAAP